ncbi:hypothetical protein BCR43DRAFT_479727 [Syncephalastrum racemosum]|uniref:Large ribosomal subunit protein bL32m n=1 Tax=Syncephalastrum racemosum TaxID=13706 RepID=A0A1X2H0R6_SYNRA|nr:hypothetical protein BCR43DRAFT_479727 [Syncephalastrum racemosum]
MVLLQNLSVLRRHTVAFQQPIARFGTIALTQGSVGPSFQVPIWLEPFLWAAPKKKTSHSKKRMRASNKGLPLKENIVECPACGNSKLLHHLCKHCYRDIKQHAKSQA